MDPKIKVKQEIPSELASQNECDSFAKELIVLKNKEGNDEIGIKTEIKQEASSIGTDTKTFAESLAFHVYSKNEKEFLPKDLIRKNEYDSGCEIEVPEQSCWLEGTAEAPSYCEETNDGRNAVELLRLSTELVPQEPALNCDTLLRMDLSLNPKQNSSEIKETSKLNNDISKTFAIEQSVYPEYSGQHTDRNIQSGASIQQNNSGECDVNKTNTTWKSTLVNYLTDKCENAYKCDTCHKSYKHLSNLKKHSSVHEAVNLHKCEVCGRTFAKMSNLKRHSLTHTGVKPHKCELCEKTFADMSGLKYHSMVHKGVKPHKCEICGKTFTFVSHLRDHKLIHEGVKPHKCEICEKNFTLRSSLKQHILIHNGVKAHKCEICGKTFICNSNLKHHILIHNGVKPHKCEICEKSFTQKCHLKKHILIH